MLTAVLFMALGPTFLVVGLLVRSERIKPNELVGLRTRATALSESAWYAGNRKSAPYFFVLSALWTIAGVFLAVLPKATFVVVFWTPTILTVPLIALMTRRANKAAIAADEKRRSASARSGNAHPD